MTEVYTELLQENSELETKILHLEQLKNKYYQQTLDDEIQINNLLEEIQQIKQDRNVENITRLSLENKRLEQENKELKKQIESQKGLITVGGKQQYEYLQEIDKLQQENKELKEMLSNKPKAMQAFQIAYSGLRKENEVLWEMVKDYKQALQEILECAKFAQCLPCGSGNLEDCLNCNDDTTNNGQFCMEKRIQEIKTLCVEVLNEVDR